MFLYAFFCWWCLFACFTAFLFCFVCLFVAVVWFGFLLLLLFVRFAWLVFCLFCFCFLHPGMALLLLLSLSRFSLLRLFVLFCKIVRLETSSASPLCDKSLYVLRQLLTRAALRLPENQGAVSSLTALSSACLVDESSTCSVSETTTATAFSATCQPSLRR